MPRLLRRGVLLATMTTLALGCASVPPLDNPLQVRPGDADEENPVLLAPGLPTPEGYAEVYDRVLDAVDDYFDIKPASRYSGVIETYPRVAPGYEQFWKPSTHDVHERLKATLQSMRHYARIRIVAGDRGGYRVFVEVFKELEIVPTPLGSNSPRALLQDSSGVDRRAEVIVGPRSAEPQWIPAGPAPHRDYNFEQVILKKIQRSQALR